MTSVSNIMLERRNLIRSFNKLKGSRIISVCAPAGYGKTVFVTQWLEKEARAKAIFTVDEYDNSLSNFCERFCAALRVCQPQNKALNDIISHPSFQSDPGEFSLRAVSALSGRKRAVLVIDDLHLIHDGEVLLLLFVYIKRLPENFQIVLVSRHDLPTGFSDLWLKGQIARISTEHLLFSNAEVKALYDKRGYQITLEKAENINRQAHGWAIGINAFLLSGKEYFDKAYDYLDDFVQTNIWEQWDNKTRNFMLHTATLRKLTPSICEAMTGVSHSDKLLKELVRRGAFIAQIQEDVFCYHYFFHLFLKQKAYERGPQFINSLLEKEGNWYLSQKDFYSALDCFIKCKSHEGIDKCYDMLEASLSSNYDVGRLLTIFKHEEIKIAAKKYPRLLFLMLWCAFVEGRIEDVTSYMDEFYLKWPEIFVNHPNSVKNILYIRILDFREPISQLINEIAELLEPGEDYYLVSPVQLSLSMHMPQLYRGLVDFSELAVGDVDENFKALFSSAGWLYGEGAPMIAETVTSGLLYEQGHLGRAHEHALSAIAQMKSRFTEETKFCAISALVMVLDALGEKDSEETVEAFNSISRMIDENKAYYLNSNFTAFSLRRKFALGNTEAAKEWLETQKTFEQPTLWGMYASFTTCRAYICVGKYDYAIILLQKVLEIVSAFNRPLDIIEAEILLSIAYWKKRRSYQKEALEHLEAAVRVAYPYGYVQMFINDGATLAGMLHKLKKRIEYEKETSEDIISFIKMLYLKTQPLSNSMHTQIKDKTAAIPVKFTDKQEAVMDLLCQGKRYKEVAEILGIKQSTVVSHIELIYKKLDVTSLADAVAKVNAIKLM